MSPEETEAVAYAAAQKMIGGANAAFAEILTENLAKMRALAAIAQPDLVPGLLVAEQMIAGIRDGVRRELARQAQG